MTDAYVYFFTMSTGAAGENAISQLPATLEVINGRGRPIMESQLVVDRTELDADGFLKAVAGNDSSAVKELTAAIRSMELRAVSRDHEALALNDSTEGQDKYMLSLESRELRKQGRKLTNQRNDTVDRETRDSQQLRTLLSTT